jgi:transposase
MQVVWGTHQIIWWTPVQERVTGMKIVQLFNREKIEYEKFKQINNKHKTAWIKTILL